MTPTTKARQKKIAQGKSSEKKNDLEQALRMIKDFHLVYDTNILDKICCDNSAHRNAIVLISAQNIPVICDTVFWEFLRNCNLDKYRKRKKQLEEHPHLIIESEDQEVKDKYVPTWMTYLIALKNDPKRMAKIKVPDIWIATFCIAKKYDRILTLDNTGDFPIELFDDEEFVIDEDKLILHLRTFKRKKASELWIEAINDDIEVAFQEWR